MPFDRPALPALMQRIQTDLEASLAGADARLRRSVEDAFAKALAGVAHELHGYLRWLSKQVIWDSAEEEFAVRWAGLFGLQKKAPSNATRVATITGVDGSVCPALAQWQTGDGLLFTQDADVTITAGAATIAITAVAAGSPSNVAPGAKLTLVNAVTGISATATVTAGGVDGVDEETAQDLLVRLLARGASAPQGGGPGDYERWALQVAGVVRAWERPLWLGLGTVGVAFVVSNDPATMIPAGPKVTEVQQYLETKSPTQTTGGGVFVFAPVAAPLNYTLSISPDTTAIRNAVRAELADFHRREADLGATLFLSRINASIAASAGLDHHTLTSPAADATAASNAIRTLGTVTFV